jgi:hypothetical protein
MSTNPIFVLKPILDLLYEEARKDQRTIECLQGTLKEVDDFRPVYAKERLDLYVYKNELDELKNKVQILEQYNRELHKENAALKAAAKPVVIDDAAYAAEANAPAHTYVEQTAVNEIVVPVIVQKEDAAAAEPEPKEESTKIVKMVGEKTKQEYQREYQRAYRKKHKEVTMIAEKYKA